MSILRAALRRAQIVTSYVHECRRQGCGYTEEAADGELRRCPKCNMKLWPKALVRPIRFHDLRHTTASLLLMAGANPAAAQRILGRHHGHRYYDWQYDQDGFRFFEHSVNLKREQALEGTYLIRTEEPQLSPVQAVSIYKELSEVERAFANLKDIIELRPIYHRSDERVQAHIFVAALAFLLHRAIEKKLKAAGVDLSATAALQALRSVKVVDLTLADGQSKRCVARGSERAARILRALGITKLDPPTPPSGEKTVM